MNRLRAAPTAHDRAAAGAPHSRASHWLQSRGHAVCVERVAVELARINTEMRDELASVGASLRDAVALLERLTAMREKQIANPTPRPHMSERLH